MESKSGSIITSKQLIFIMVGCFLGSGVLSLPRNTAKEVGQDAWMAVIIGSVIPVISFLLIRYMYKRNNAGSFVDICRKAGGRFWGSIFSGIFAVYSIFATAIFLRMFIELISVFLLIETPMPVKLALTLVLCAYLASGNVKVVGRVNEFLFYILLPLYFFPLPVLLINSDYRNLMPVLNFKVMDYVRGALATSLAFSGYELYMVFHPYVSREKESLGASLKGLLITTVIYLYAVISTILVFGSELTKIITWPALRLLATAEVPVFERIEFLFLQAWIGVAIRPMSNQYFCASHIIAELLKLKSQKWVTLALFPIIIAIAYYPGDEFQVFKFSGYIGVSAIAIGIVLPIILIIFGTFTGKRTGKQSENK